MIKNQIYSVELADLVKKKQLIPRKINYNEHLKIYKRYWLDESKSYFKVEDSYIIRGNEYYSVKYAGEMFGQLSYPVDNSCYELRTDRKNIKEISSIINTNKSYLGAEIKYWFFVHSIDLESKEYKEFNSFLNPRSKSLISDNKFYFLFGKIVNGNYVDCKICVDENKSKKKKRKR